MSDADSARDAVLQKLKTYCLWRRFSIDADEPPQAYETPSTHAFYDAQANAVAYHDNVRGFCCLNERGQVVCSGAVTPALHAKILAVHHTQAYLSPDCELVGELSRLCNVATQLESAKPFLENHALLHPTRSAPRRDENADACPVLASSDPVMWVNVSSPHPRIFEYDTSRPDMFWATWTGGTEARPPAATPVPLPIRLSERTDAEFECVVDTYHTALSRMRDRMDPVPNGDHVSMKNYEHFLSALHLRDYDAEDAGDSLVLSDVEDMRQRLKAPFCDVDKKIALPADAFQYYASASSDGTGVVRGYHFFHTDVRENTKAATRKFTVRDVVVGTEIVGRTLSYAEVMQLVKTTRQPPDGVDDYDYDIDPENPATAWIGYVDESHAIVLTNEAKRASTGTATREMFKYETKPNVHYCTYKFDRHSRPPVRFFQAAAACEVRGKATIPAPSSDVQLDDVIGVSLTFRSKPCAYAVLASVEAFRVLWSNEPRDERGFIPTARIDYAYYDDALKDMTFAHTQNIGRIKPSMRHRMVKQVRAGTSGGGEVVLCCNANGYDFQAVSFSKFWQDPDVRDALPAGVDKNNLRMVLEEAPHRLVAHALVGLWFPSSDTDDAAQASTRTSGLTSDATAQRFGVKIDGAANCGRMMAAVLTQISNSLDHPIVLWSGARPGINPLVTTSADCKGWSPLVAPRSHVALTNDRAVTIPRLTAFIPNVPYTVTGATVITRDLKWHRVAKPTHHDPKFTIVNDRLTAQLVNGKCVFTMDEWKELNVGTKLCLEHHTRVGGHIYEVKYVHHMCVLDLKSGERICLPIVGGSPTSHFQLYPLHGTHASPIDRMIRGTRLDLDADVRTRGVVKPRSVSADGGSFVLVGVDSEVHVRLGVGSRVPLVDNALVAVEGRLTSATGGVVLDASDVQTSSASIAYEDGGRHFWYDSMFLGRPPNGSPHIRFDKSFNVAVSTELVSLAFAGPSSASRGLCIVLHNTRFTIPATAYKPSPQTRVLFNRSLQSVVRRAAMRARTGDIEKNGARALNENERPRGHGPVLQGASADQ